MATTLLIFGGPVDDNISALRRLYCLSKSRPLVQSFLRQAVDALRAELAVLMLAERERIGPFNDLLELAEASASHEHPFEASNFALTTTIQATEYLMSVLT